jgi:hypothetical protein
MELWNRKAKGRLLSVFVSVLANVLSLQIGIYACRTWGWSLFGTAIASMLVLSIAIIPVTSKIQRHYGVRDESAPTP